MMSGRFVPVMTVTTQCISSGMPVNRPQSNIRLLRDAATGKSLDAVAVPSACPSGQQERATATVIEQAELVAANWAT